MKVIHMFNDDKKLCKKTYYYEKHKSKICFIENYNLNGFLDEIINYDFNIQEINFILKFTEKGNLKEKLIYHYFNGKFDYIEQETYNFGEIN